MFRESNVDIFSVYVYVLGTYSQVLTLQSEVSRCLKVFCHSLLRPLGPRASILAAVAPLAEANAERTLALQKAPG